MLNYKYQALSNDNTLVSGVVSANNEFEAIAKIKQDYAVVTKISVSNSDTSSAKAVNKKIPEKALAMMCSQFSIIVKAGMPIVRTVELISAQTSDSSLRNILKQVALDVSAGFSLAQSFENNGPNLPTTFIETIRSGEASGTLDTAFGRLHTYYDKSAKLRGKLVSALTYPAFTCIVAVIVIVIIMTKAVPVFVGSFADMGASLPLPTKILVAVSDFFNNYILIILGVLAILMLTYILYSKTEKGLLNIARLKLKLPIIGKLSLMKCASEFANTMSTMLSAGLSIISAVNITGRAMSNRYLGSLLESAVPQLESGKTLESCMRRMPLLPELLTEMAAVGEETGSLESTLDVIGLYYDSETEIKSAQVVSMVEPIIICVLAVVVVGILLAVYLPMFSLYASV